MDFIARIISFLTNPLFILFPLPYLLLYRVDSNSYNALKWTVFTLFFLLVIGMFMLIEVRRGVFSDLDVSKREQRPLLFGFISLVTGLYIISLLLFHGPVVLYVTIVGIMIGVIMVSVINTRIKASIHVATITAVLLTIGILYHVNVATLLLIPLIGWARIKIKRHTLQEALTGGIVGGFLTFFMYIVVKYMLHWRI